VHVLLLRVLLTPCHTLTGSAGTPSQIITAALNIFDDTAPEVQTQGADKDDMVMSKRKKEQLAEAKRRQEDKYATETELDINTLEELDTTGRLEISGKVMLRCIVSYYVIALFWGLGLRQYLHDRAASICQLFSTEN
jgi:hypothetical protein